MAINWRLEDAIVIAPLKAYEHYKLTFYGVVRVGTAYHLKWGFFGDASSGPHGNQERETHSHTQYEPPERPERERGPAQWNDLHFDDTPVHEVLIVSFSSSNTTSILCKYLGIGDQTQQ